MINKMYRFIFLGSLTIMALFILFIIPGLLFFDAYANYPTLSRIAGVVVLITPFAPIGTLFGTLKENQSIRKKISIISATLIAVLFLIVLVWGTLIALTFD